MKLFCILLGVKIVATKPDWSQLILLFFTYYDEPDKSVLFFFQNG